MKAFEQSGFEFEDRGSHNWVFLRTWRKEDFYHMAVSVIGRFYGDASSELVVFGQVLCAIGSGASLLSFSGDHTPLSSGTRSLLGAGTRKGCWTTAFSMSSYSNTAYKNCFYCVLNAKLFLNDRLHYYSSEGC